MGDQDKVAARLSQRVKAVTRLEVRRNANGRPMSSEAFQVYAVSLSLFSIESNVVSMCTL